MVQTRLRVHFYLKPGEMPVSVLLHEWFGQIGYLPNVCNSEIFPDHALEILTNNLTSRDV